MPLFNVEYHGNDIKQDTWLPQTANRKWCVAYWTLVIRLS